MSTINFEIPNNRTYRLAADGLDNLVDWTPVMARLASMLHSFVEENFAAEGRPKKWPSLSPAYARDKAEAGKSGKLLQYSGDLLQSIQPGYGYDYAEVSTNKIYAAIHHYGGMIKPRRGRKALQFALGGKLITRRSVTIPPRPYMAITRGDAEDIDAEVNDHIMRRLGMQNGGRL